MAEIRIFQRPANPVISPGTTEPTGPISVTISSASEKAEIHYTLDGSDPTATSPTYDGPIAISSDTTIKAIAIKSGKSSQIVSTTYKFRLATGGSFLIGGSGTPYKSYLSIPSGVTFGVSATVDSIDVGFYYDSTQGISLASMAWLKNIGKAPSKLTTFRHTIIMAVPQKILYSSELRSILADPIAKMEISEVPTSGWFAVKTEAGKQVAIKVTGISGSGNDATISGQIYY